MGTHEGVVDHKQLDYNLDEKNIHVIIELLLVPKKIFYQLLQNAEVIELVLYLMLNGQIRGLKLKHGNYWEVKVKVINQ